MSLQTRLSSLISAIGSDIKSLQTQVNTHIHDNRYYTETESDSKFFPKIDSAAYFKSSKAVVKYQHRADNTVGELVIQTNLTTATNNMYLIKISGYNYAANKTYLDLTLGFYMYSQGTPPSVLSSGALNSGTFDISQVRVMKRTSDNALAIVVTPTVSWSWTSIEVDVLSSYTLASDASLSGWTAVVKTDISELTSLLTLPLARTSLDGHNHDGLYYTKAQIDTSLATNATNDRNRANHTGTQAISTIVNLQSSLDAKSATTHTHDDRYYTETESDARYPRSMTTITSGSFNDVTQAGTYQISNLANITEAPSGAYAWGILVVSVYSTYILQQYFPDSDGSTITPQFSRIRWAGTWRQWRGAVTPLHTHDDRYYTETEVNTLLSPKAVYEASSLASIPIPVSGGTLPTSLSTIGGSWWRMDPADYPTPPSGRNLQYRLVVSAHSLNSGDVLSGLLYNTKTSAGMSAEFTRTANGDDITNLVGPWTNLTTAANGYVMIRNVTASRGFVVSAFIELRIA